MVFSLVGWSGSGKTGVITALISHFKGRGQTVLALKNVPHEYTLQPEGKDSFQFLAAGADRSVLTSQGEIMVMKRKQEKENLLETIQSILPDADWVLMEGLVLENVPVIQVLDSRTEKGFKFPLEKSYAIVSDREVPADIPRFDRADISGLAQHMEDHKHD